MTMNFSNTNDNQALIWAYACHADGYHALDGSAVHVSNTNHLQWAHVRYDAEDAATQLQSFGLDESVIEALTADETRPRTFGINNGVLMVLRGINANHNTEPEEMISIRIWFTNNCIITARRQGGTILSIEDVRAAFDQRNPPNTAGAFVVTLVEKIADRIGEIVDMIEDELIHFESNMADVPHEKARYRLAMARRQTASVRRYLAPQRDALDLLSRMKTVLTDEDAFGLKQQTDRTTRYVEDLDLARERAIFLNEELRNQIAEQQNKRMYVFSIVTAVFLPLSFLTGVFGMNVAGLPGTENGDAFLYLASAMGLLALVIIGVMYWRKWL